MNNTLNWCGAGVVALSLGACCGARLDERASLLKRSVCETQRVAVGAALVRPFGADVEHRVSNPELARLEADRIQVVATGYLAITGFEAGRFYDVCRQEAIDPSAIRFETESDRSSTEQTLRLRNRLRFAASLVDASSEVLGGTVCPEFRFEPEGAFEVGTCRPVLRSEPWEQGPVWTELTANTMALGTRGTVHVRAGRFERSFPFEVVE